jgi:conjugative transfer signal peptidase TraF
MTERRDLPLFAWGDALRAARLRRSRLRRSFVAGAAGIALLWATIVAPPPPRLVWNASASAPLGLYAVSPGASLARGDMMIAWAPPGPRLLAARRHYLPVNVPLVKRVRGVPGDRICALGDTIRINGWVAAARLRRDTAGRPLPWWRGCITLRDGALLLLTDPPASFDGRYFGPTAARDVIGKATPLWVR